MGERQRKEDSDYQRSGYVAHDEQRSQQDAQRNAQCEEDWPVQRRADQSSLVLTPNLATLFTEPRRSSETVRKVAGEGSIVCLMDRGSRKSGSLPCFMAVCEPQFGASRDFSDSLVKLSEKPPRTLG
jgi:hypothetical protein